MIDLHLHTTASDGRSTPEQLVAEAAAAGIVTLAITDHDTVGGIEAANAAARARGLQCVAGIEITAVDDGRDVHVLGYFIDIADASLAGFLRAQREDRRRRVLEIVDRLTRLGAPIDAAPFLQEAHAGGRSLGRPLVAAALVSAGHAVDIPDAFERFLAEGKPAFVERRGTSPADVVARIRAAGGVASLAHPGKLGRDGVIAPMVDAGLDAIEVFHPDHGPDDVAHYREAARHYRLLITGGSDYHGPGSGREQGFGRVGLPPEDFVALSGHAEAQRG